MRMTHVSKYVDCVRIYYPDLKFEAVRVHNTDGQLNEILIVNETLVFRFPRSSEIAETFAVQVKLLEILQPQLSLPIPNPIFKNLDGSRCYVFMGYPKLPGEPLWRETLAQIKDEIILDRLAAQLARFLRDLHGIPVGELDFDLPLQNGREMWSEMYEAFRTHLFPYMRADARASVTANFERFLNSPHQFAYQPTLRHGDFGSGNILYDPAAQTITGIIDFDSLGLGDPAVDVGAVLSLGEDFFHRMCRTYPGMAAMRTRTKFYQSTYALQEALYGLRDGVVESFEAGIADYR